MDHPQQTRQFWNCAFFQDMGAEIAAKFQANGLIYRPSSGVCEARLCSGRQGALAGCKDSADLWGQKSCGLNLNLARGLLSKADVFPRLSCHTLRSPWNVRGRH